jgi:hypothetical protein
LKHFNLKDKTNLGPLQSSTLETTQGQIDGFFSQIPFKFYLPEVASVEDGLEIFPWVASRVVYVPYSLGSGSLDGPLTRLRGTSFPGERERVFN